MRHVLKNRSNIIYLSILFLITLASVTAVYWLPHSPYYINPDNRLIAPSTTFWFGTDDFGRDLFGRTIVAAKVSLLVGSVVALISTFIGTVVGLLSGYYRRADFAIMRIIDGMLAFPSFLLALALVAALGGSLTNIIIALTFAFSPVIARIVRSGVLQTSSVSYIDAAKTTGVSDMTILLKYILPNIMTPIIVQGTFVFAKAVLAEAALSFLGVGIDPSVPSLGNMLQEAQIYILVAPWYSIFPGISIVLTVLLLNLLGDGLRYELDPHTKRRRKRKRLTKRALVKT